MKKLILSLLFLGFTTIIQAQDYRFEISQVSLSVKEKGKWSAFTPFKDAKIMAALNTRKNTFVVYSEIEQYFKIKKFYDTRIEDGKEIIAFDCYDQYQENCYIEIQTRKKENMSQLYIKYSDRMMVYNMKYKK